MISDLGFNLLGSSIIKGIHLVEAAGLSAGRLVQLLREMPYFNDVEPYDELEVPFFKRAQIVAADLAVAFKGQSWGYFEDMDQLISSPMGQS